MLILRYILATKYTRYDIRDDRTYEQNDRTIKNAFIMMETSTRGNLYF